MVKELVEPMLQQIFDLKPASHIRLFAERSVTKTEQCVVWVLRSFLPFDSIWQKCACYSRLLSLMEAL